MRRITYISLVLLFSASIISCSKEHTCECTATANGISTVAETILSDISSNEAEVICESRNLPTDTVQGVILSNTCVIK